MERIHEMATRDAQHLDDVLAAFKGLHVKQLVADDNVYRSLRSVSVTSSTEAWAPKPSSAC